MFKRLVFEDYAAICTLIAFAVVALVFLGAIWRALRMTRRQSDHMAALPFEPSPHTSPSTALHQAHDDEHPRRT